MGTKIALLTTGIVLGAGLTQLMTPAHAQAPGSSLPSFVTVGSCVRIGGNAERVYAIEKSWVRTTDGQRAVGDTWVNLALVPMIQGPCAAR